jgi:hypothetical protein
MGRSAEGHISLECRPVTGEEAFSPPTAPGGTMTTPSKNDPDPFEYLKLFGIKSRNENNELRIAEEKGLTASQISTFCRMTTLSLDDLATVLRVSRRQINGRMRKGQFSAGEADILMSLGRIICEYFRLYPDIQDFWLLFLARSEEFQGRSAVDLSKTEIGRKRVFAHICRERDEYLEKMSK